MHTQSLAPWTHDHSFGQDARRPAERRAFLVMVVTAVMMVGEIVAGMAFGSMALLADGIHMATHAGALALTAFAYAYARTRANDRRFSFGTGKVNALAGFTNAVLLAAVALFMAVESVERLLDPRPIDFGPAIAIAVLGLAVNLVCAFLLTGGHEHGHHGHHAHHDHHGHDHHAHHHHGHEEDANLKAAVMHVIADALTSVLAIVALLAGLYLGWNWLDPVMGVLGAVLVGRWAYGLIGGSARVLLDFQAPPDTADSVRAALEADGDTRVADLHIWSVGPGVYTLVASVVAHAPQPPEAYKARLPHSLSIVHPVIEVRQCTGGACGA
ncbi:cation diffusion facilitator family transporter [Azospirillum fermentarium]|uniref:CDF family Co(II)/Ni(II) efflux transporter DmeF n=1 Tax=Azospirillum fermentarium TaxID=1233114 RepID=UPI00222669BB|nr:CDF family Co(II)/Ni(II) efflux transporter DmeF [Azospirillum fermentarium]MCW2246129.1 cation diffusion facilitator family transporter [Azospirillum fermentarium]